MLLPVALGLGACGLNDLDKPAPPLEAQVAEDDFEQPTGTLQDTPVSELLQALSDTRRAIELLCGWDSVFDTECLQDPVCGQCAAATRTADAVRDLAASFEPEGEEARPVEGVSGVEGLLYVERICGGHAKKPVPDPETGIFDSILGFTGRGLDPTIWGTTQECEVYSDGDPLTLDGDYFFRFEASAVPPSELDRVPVIFAFDGEITVAGKGGRPDEEIDAEFAMQTRLDGTGPLDILVRVPGNGSFLYRVDEKGVSIVSSEGIWTCDLEVPECGNVERF